jgi:hypothetical protein
MPCKIEGCEETSKLRLGLCGKHYMRLKRTGDPLKARKPGRQTSIRSHPLYGAWAGMVNRCTNPNNSSYGRYGGRGITVCDRWRKFENFLADMGERPDGMTLDRINPRGPYAPGNCRWATPKEQRANVDPEREAAGRKINSEKRTAYWAKWRQERGR